MPLRVDWRRPIGTFWAASLGLGWRNHVVLIEFDDSIAGWEGEAI